MIKDFDITKTYTIAFKNGDSARQMLDNAKFALAPEYRNVASDDGWIEHLTGKQRKAFYALSLYSDVMDHGEAYGGYLQMLRGIDAGLLQYLTIKVKEG